MAGRGIDDLTDPWYEGAPRPEEIAAASWPATICVGTSGPADEVLEYVLHVRPGCGARIPSASEDDMLRDVYDEIGDCVLVRVASADDAERLCDRIAGAWRLTPGGVP